MENVNNPNLIVRPQGNVEKITSFFQKGGITKDLLERLAAFNTTVTFPDGSSKKFAMADVKRQINREIEFNKKYNPDGFIYNKAAEANRQRAKRMDASLQKNDYRALIKPMLDSSLEEWRMAERRDERANAMSPKERAEAEAAHKHTVDVEEEISKRERKTGVREEHGIPPIFTEVGGETFRVRSQVYLAYAIVLAKKVVQESR